MGVLTYKPGASQTYRSPRITDFDVVSPPPTSSKLEPLDDEVLLTVLAVQHRSRAYNRVLDFLGIPRRDSVRTMKYIRIWSFRLREVGSRTIAARA
jgi:hypothetical protein